MRMMHIIRKKHRLAYLTLLLRTIYMIEELELEKKKKKKSNKVIRTDAILRETSSNYIRLIGDADRKARIMIVVNSILLTISVTLLTKALNDKPDVWISATLLMAANLVTLFFSIISVKPELHSSIGKETENNILHYKKCMEYSLMDYSTQILDTMADGDKKMEAVIKNLYFFGNLLCMKYKLLKIAYRMFFWGILLSVISYFIIIGISKLKHNG